MSTHFDWAVGSQSKGRTILASLITSHCDGTPGGERNQRRRSDVWIRNYKYSLSYQVYSREPQIKKKPILLLADTSGYRLSVMYVATQIFVVPRSSIESLGNGPRGLSDVVVVVIH